MTNKLHAAPSNRDDAVARPTDDGVPVVLHPLVVLNVSDHFTRIAAMNTYHASSHGQSTEPTITDSDGNPRVIGILLGTQHGRTVEVCHSFELPVTLDVNGEITLDEAFTTSRIKQYNQIFSQYSIVGWYTTGKEVTKADINLHVGTFSTLTEAPILLVMNPSLCKSNVNAASVHPDPQTALTDAKLKGHAPGILVTYQLELKLVQDTTDLRLSPVAHKYASEDSERIAVDHVMRHAVPGAGDGTSSTTLHLATLRRSISMLKTRLELLVAFLEATERGEIPVDHALMRQVASVCSRLPALDCDEFSAAFVDERDDSLAVTYLAGVTKSLASLHEAINLFNRSNSKANVANSARRRSALFRS